MDEYVSYIGTKIMGHLFGEDSYIPGLFLLFISFKTLKYHVGIFKLFSMYVTTWCYLTLEKIECVSEEQQKFLV